VMRLAQPSDIFLAWVCERANHVMLWPHKSLSHTWSHAVAKGGPRSWPDHHMQEQNEDNADGFTRFYGGILLLTTTASFGS
jgi:hypothetical protein